MEAHVHILCWVKQCTSSHKACDRANKLQDLPTRVVEIEGPKQARFLVDSGEMKGHYACLSHAWGENAKIIRTTSLTLPKFQRKIAWEVLPKNFQDAIEVASRLSEIYLDRFLVHSLR